MELLGWIIYGSAMIGLMYLLFRKPSNKLTEKEEVAMFLTAELTNAVWLMTKEQYHDQLLKWSDAYGSQTELGDALVKEAFEMTDCFYKELERRRNLKP